MSSEQSITPRVICVVAAVLVAAVVGMAPHRSPDTRAPRALPGPVDEVYADPVNLMYSYGPSEVERHALRAASVFTANITVTYDAGFAANPQAEAAFQAAVNIWETVISSPAPIRVNASFRDLGNPNVLGSAGPQRSCSPPNGLPNTFYAAALADKLNGSAFCASLAPAIAGEITANFNSTFTNWDFGTSGAPVSGKYSFMTVVLHELGHGLGFIGSMKASGGTGSFGFPPTYPNFVDIYDRFAVTGAGAALIAFVNPSTALGTQLVSNDTYFSGGNARVDNAGQNPKLETHNMTTQYGFASDNGFLQGSSYAHIDDTFYTGTPNGLMTFQLAQAEVFTDPGPIVRGVFADLGWTITNHCSYSLSSTSFTTNSAPTTNSVDVTSDPGCGWTAVSNANWLTVTSGGNGNGSGTITYAVAANNGPARTGTLTIAGQTYTVTQTAHITSRGDFDGDGKADLTVFRPSTGIWYTRNSATASNAFSQWGLNGDVPVPGDYDGDGRIDLAVFRPSTGIWYIVNSGIGNRAFLQWGINGDVPVPGDYDGDGRTDVAVFRPSTGIWYVVDSSTGANAFYQWGVAGDVPVPGDYDGDGRADLAVFRPSTGVWYVVNSSTGAGAFYQWGVNGDVPVPGDYDGDGKTDVAVFRPSTGIWYVLNSRAHTSAFYQWGLSADVPVPGDYDGDGKADVAVFRPSTGIWYIVNSSTGAAAFYQWGLSGDIPILTRR